VAVAESATQADTRSVCVICTTVGRQFNWYRVSRGFSAITEFLVGRGEIGAYETNNQSVVSCISHYRSRLLTT